MGDFRFVDVDAGANDGRIDNRLVADFGPLHQDGIFDQSRRMNFGAFLYAAVFQNHAVIDICRIFQIAQGDGVANFGSTVNAHLFADPGISDDVGVGDNGVLSNDSVRQQDFVPPGFHLLDEGSACLGIHFGKKLHLDQFGGDVRDNSDRASAHLVSDGDFCTDLIVGFPIGDKGSDVLHDRALHHPDVGHKAHMVNQRIFNNAVVNGTGINSGGRGNVARHQKRAVKSGQVDFSRKRRSGNAVGRKSGIDGNLGPVFTAVAVFFQRFDFLRRKGAAFDRSAACAKIFRIAVHRTGL